MNRLLATDGNGSFYQTEYIDPTPGIRDVLVKSILTGVCRSDIDMMNGYFDILPLSMQGHEGLGEVVQIGENVLDVEPGDIVATRGEPAFADYYVAKHREYVKVPEVDPKYIIEPVACAINIVDYCLIELKKRQGKGQRLLLLGSGFLSWIVYQIIPLYNLYYNITAVGNNNKELWGDRLVQDYDGNYDVVIDLSGRLDVFHKDILKNETLVIMGSQKTVTTDFSSFLWKACTVIFPSPRTDNFYYCMKTAAELIQNGKLSTDGLWTRSYSRDNNWMDAFGDSANRKPGFSRAYLDWREK